MPMVSVLVSVYNMQNTLGWAIRSVLAQTYQNWELWIGDDASDDGTVREALAMKDPRIHLLEGNTNRGKASMMNRLLEQATGRYIMELDGDDWLPPDALRELVAAMEAVPLAGIATGRYGCWFRSRQLGCSWRGCVIPDEEKQSKVPITDPGHDKGHRPHPPVPRFYRKTALEAVGGWTKRGDTWGRVFEDIEITSRLLNLYPMVRIPKLLYHRVIHPGSISQRSRERFDDWMKIQNKGG